MMNKMFDFTNKFSKTNFIILLVCIVTLVYYGQSLFFDFLTFDDDKFITLNKIITSDNSSIIDCFKYQFKESTYFPLTFVSFRVLRNLFGLNPAYFHALNLILHLLNIILIYFLSLKILKKLSSSLVNKELWSGVIALLFSIHPIHVESVAWAIDLKDMLFSFFYIFGLLTYWNWLEERKVRFYLLTIVFALFSILSKSTAITFIAILFWVDWLNGERLNRNLFISKIQLSNIDESFTSLISYLDLIGPLEDEAMGGFAEPRRRIDWYQSIYFNTILQFRIHL
jgi:protein O-mannosyl-transferase